MICCSFMLRGSRLTSPGFSMRFHGDHAQRRPLGGTDGPLSTPSTRFRLPPKLINPFPTLEYGSVFRARAAPLEPPETD